jgi:hypothetical protein
MRTLSLAFAILLSGASASAQAPGQPRVTIPASWIQGFARAVSGELLVYPWAYPGQARALLSRTTDGTMRVEWEGEPAPDGPPDERVTFLWHAGTASGYGAHRFTFSINGHVCTAFTSGRDPSDREWVRQGEGGCVLSFTTTRVGTFNELFGLMMASVPRRLVGAGPPRFAVVGEAAGSRDYYMTFQEPVRAWVRAAPQQARFKDGSRVVRVEVSRIAAPAPVEVRTGTLALWSGTAETGYTSALVPVPGDSPTLPLAVEIAGRDELAQELSLPPIRKWEIHLLPHSHVDIGYSDPQPVVEQKQWKNLRDAMDLARVTAANPPEARFRWNVEGLWAVEGYLRQAGDAEVTAFVDAVKAGSIGLQANYTNILTGLSSPEELERWTDAAGRLREAHGLGPIRSAMHTDIPGLSWPVVSAMARSGVRYFSSGPNYMPGLPDRGDRIGQTLHALGDQPFWWVSPSGQERLLFWMTGRGYSWFHGLNAGKITTAGPQMMLDYLGQLTADGYAWDMVQVRYTIGGDNGPVDPELPGFVKTWNERFETPTLVINTADAMFAEFERRHGASLPKRAGDMTPYWEDGAVSSAAEEAMVRAAARRVQQAETLQVMRGFASTLPGRNPAEAWRNVTLWHEHTWGAADSISRPDRADVVEQWNYKRNFALEADRRSRVLIGEEPGPAATTLDIVNTQSWIRSGLVVLPASSTGRTRVVETDGRPLVSQRLSDGRLAVWAADVPALGALRVSLVSGSPAPPASPVRVDGFSLDNGVLSLSIDGETGSIVGLRARDAGAINLAKPGQPLGEYLYVPGRDPSAVRRVGKPLVVVEEAGPLVATVRIEGPAPGVTHLVRRVSLVAGADHARIETILDKELVREKESAHLAFPFNLEGAVVRADEGEALVAIEADQLPGSCKDFIGVHAAIDVSNGDRGVALASIDAPLIEIGALTDERSVEGGPRAWRTKAAPGPNVYAYLLNNYWHTNYKADQSGPMTFRFALRPHGAFDAAALRRFGGDHEQPLLALAVPAGAPPVTPPFRVQGEGVVVSSLRYAEAGAPATVRLYNASASPATATLIGPESRPLKVALWRDERWQAPSDAPIALPPFGIVVLRYETDRQ